MNAVQLIFLVLVFVAVFAVAMAAMWLFSPNPLRQRLQGVLGATVSDDVSPQSKWVETIVRAATPLAKLRLPDPGWEGSALRIRFMNAGFRDPMAPVLFFAAKVVLAVGLPLLLFFYLTLSGATARPEMVFALLFLCCGIGYYLPNLVLRHITNRRKRDIFEAFPDALDLLTVCVEAGLGLDAALQRVAEEIRLTSPALSDELTLVTLELRAGSAKEAALRNLALRTGVEEVDTLVAMLIQAERFGTSTADSLRVHADTLRTKRRLRAEELAAKVALKLLFPLIFCIFPTLMLVLLGPAFIQISRILLPTMTGGQ
ncbi:pilus assembly protein TadC [Oryzomicrobium terrae]|uniref:Pilus assembly protein TadC n=1 Tax=Oryzomicrobium terrae TaxID=1735038 RepID=A0A5C1E3T1_9RHOO|nr:type II secretion system F family protein [Oryzomicrobium terrae]QEL63562.1 pilus assembly protein TadC [Oryzomicrobium terrae]